MTHTNSEQKHQGFKYKILGYLPPDDAFARLISIMAIERSSEIANLVGDRGYKMALHSADIKTDDFIAEKMQHGSPFEPVWCLFDKDGYIFFGRF